MKLHGHAALSLNVRRRMVRRVVDEGWSLAQAAEAAEVSVQVITNAECKSRSRSWRPAIGSSTAAA